MQALLGENDSQTQKQFAEKLRVSQQAVSKESLFTIVSIYFENPRRKKLWVVYLPDLAHSDYQLFASIGPAPGQQRFGSYGDVKEV